MILNIPDDIFKYELVQYLTLYDVGIFDTAIINNNNRVQFLNKISEVTLKDNINIYKFNIKLLYKWLIIRKIKNIFKRDEQIIQMPKDIFNDKFNWNNYIHLPESIQKKNYLETIDFNKKVNFGVDLGISDTFDNWYPIHWICYHESFEIIKYVIDKGIDLEKTSSKGWRPIHFICNKSNCESSVQFDIIKYIINKGIDIEAETNDGWRPIHFIGCKYSTPEIIKYFIDKKVNLKGETNDGYYINKQKLINNYPLPLQNGRLERYYYI